MTDSNDDIAARNFVKGLLQSAAVSAKEGQVLGQFPTHVVDAIAEARAENTSARERYHSQMLPLVNHVPNPDAVDTHAFLRAPAFDCILNKKRRYRNNTVTIAELIKQFMLEGTNYSYGELDHLLKRLFGGGLELQWEPDCVDLVLDTGHEQVIAEFIKGGQHRFIADLAPYAAGVLVGSEPELLAFSREPNLLYFKIARKN